MKSKRFIQVLCALALAFGALPATAVTALAADPITTDVVIHKRNVDSSATLQDHDGSELATPPGVHLGGIIFKYWTISNAATPAQIAQLKGLADIDAIEAYATANPTILSGGTTTAATSTTDGTVRISAMPEGRYLFGEVNGASQNVAGYIGVPFVLELPAMKPTGDAYYGTGTNALHVYPKNTVSSPGLDVETVDEINQNRIGSSSFTVAVKDGSGNWNLVGSLGSGGTIVLPNGYITLSDLPAGDYRLINTVAPDGYVSDNRPIYFNVAAGNITFDPANATGSPKSSFTAGTSSTNPMITLELNKEADIEKVEDAGGTAQVGETITWTINITVPSEIEDYTKLIVKDQIDPRLDFSGTSEITVKAGATDLGTPANYTATYNTTSRELAITFVPSSLASYERQKITITYETVINEDAEMGEGIPNDATIDYNNGHGMEGEVEPPVVPEVWTGGAKFSKVDGADDTIVLPGAEFKIATNAAGTTFMKWTQGLIDIATGAGKAGATAGLVFKGTPVVGEDIVMVSNSAGLFGMVGLKGGDYYLVETKAPAGGYNLLRDPEKFTVTKTSFADTSTIKIENNTGLQIPQTGGIGTVLFTVVGLALMGSAIVLFRRKKEQDTTNVVG